MDIVKTVNLFCRNNGILNKHNDIDKGFVIMKGIQESIGVYMEEIITNRGLNPELALIKFTDVLRENEISKCLCESVLLKLLIVVDLNNSYLLSDIAVDSENFNMTRILIVRLKADIIGNQFTHIYFNDFQTHDVPDPYEKFKHVTVVKNPTAYNTIVTKLIDEGISKYVCDNIVLKISNIIKTTRVDVASLSELFDIVRYNGEYILRKLLS
jgi:hypothetical protein